MRPHAVTAERTSEPGAQDEPQRDQPLTKAIREAPGTLPAGADIAAESLVTGVKVADVARRYGTTPDAPSSKARFHWWIIVGCTPNRLASSAAVSSPFRASSATFALN